MLFRFSLYGFLKNQQYYEPFLILAFREKGLTFLQIGILIAFREAMINLFEIPSGIIADLQGRRRCMILSFAAYIVSFVLFAMADTMTALFPAMLLFAVGEAFRTGTHKAMIFHWLKLQGRLDERTRVYGFTRSWSKIGSAVSALIAGGLVFYSGRYSSIFWFCIIPYAAAIVNFMGYPRTLEIEAVRKVTIAESFGAMLRVIRESLSNRRLRRVFFESMGFQGYFEAAMGYLQPTIKSLALALPLFIGLSAERRSALLVAAVYSLLFILSALASRFAHRLESGRGGGPEAARILWGVTFAVYLVLAAALFRGSHGTAVGMFVLLYIIQNFWQPLLYSRIDRASGSELGATVLSIEQQVRSIFTVVVAPLLGYGVDRFGFTPVGLAGAAVAGFFFTLSSRRRAGV